MYADDGKGITEFLYYLFSGREHICSCIEEFICSDEYGVEAFRPGRGLNPLRNLSEEEFDKFLDYLIMELIEKKVFSSDAARMFSHREIDRIVRRAFYAIRKDLDIIEPYAEDPEVTEIMINGKDNIFIEKNGRIEKTDMYFEETADLEEVIRRVASKVHREINELNPIVDARLDDGSRVNAVYKNVAFGGPTFTIRKFPEKAYTMDDMLRFGTITAECAEYLHTLVLTGHNIFISGGTSSGKTTLLNVLSNYIPKHERVIVIEDSLELQIENIDNIVRLECKNANVSGRGGVTMRDLIKTSLRMRPDRIIVGEVRGREIIDMLAAMDLIQINMKGTSDRNFLIRECNLGFAFGAKVNGRSFSYAHKY